MSQTMSPSNFITLLLEKAGDWEELLEQRDNAIRDETIEECLSVFNFPNTRKADFIAAIKNLKSTVPKETL